MQAGVKWAHSWTGNTRTMTDITDADLDRLAQWDTPTICNALEITHPERRGHGFTLRPFTALRPDHAPIVGRARTVRIRAAQPDLREGASRLPYYEYVAQGTRKIVVVEDLDPLPGVGAFWGEVHTAVHLGLGCLGALTNGSMRDLPDSAAGFQLLAGAVNPSHAFVHPVDFGGAVTIHGMEVHHDDIVHADRHGAVVVPADAVRAIPDAVALIARREARILEAARRPGFGIDALRAALGEAADIH